MMDITKFLLEKALPLLTGPIQNSKRDEPTSFEKYTASMAMINSFVLYMSMKVQLIIKISEDLRKGPLNSKVCLNFIFKKKCTLRLHSIGTY